MKKKLKYIIAIILIILFTFSIVPKNFQNDTFYMIELGRQIEKTGIDWKDHWSIHQNLQYRYPHWLFDLICSNIFENLGFTGIYVFTQMCSSIFIILIFINLLKKDVNFNLAFIGTLVTSYLMKGGFYARGQIISYSLFLIEYMILERFVQRPTVLKTLGLFIISCLMANIHSTIWIMMLVLLLPFIGEKIVYCYSLSGINDRLLKKNYKSLEKAKIDDNKEKILKIEEEIKSLEKFKKVNENNKENKNYKIIITNNKNIKFLWIAAMAIFLGALVTPLKLTPILYFLKTSLGNTMSYINEHLPIVIGNSLEFLVYTIILVALIGFTNVKLKLSDGFLILGLYFMTITSQRNVYLLIGLTSCIIIKLIDDFIKSNIEKENVKFQKRIFIVICIITVVISCYFFIS